MQIGASNVIPPQTCPLCGLEVGRATAIGGMAKPNPGDFTICIGCGGILHFDDRLWLVKCSTEEEFKVLAEGERDKLEVVQLVIKAAIRIPVLIEEE
jgi:hypothetical protein